MKKCALFFLLAFTLLGCKKAIEADKSANETEQNAAARTTIVGIDAATNILDNGYGYNTRFPDTFEPWTSNDLFWTNALQSSFANCIRYPGGTVANFWAGGQTILFSRKATADPDGWIDPAKTGFDFINQYIIPGTQQKNSLADLSQAVSTTGASAVFVLNVVTPGKDFYASPQGWNRAVNDNPPSTTNFNTPLSDDWYKMLDNRYTRTKTMLVKAKQNNVPIRYIEIGNEVYLSNSTYYKEAFPTGEDYAIAANYIVNKLKADPDLNFDSNVEFSVPGAAEKVAFTGTRMLNWNRQLLSRLNANLFDYITLHSYQEADMDLTEYATATALYGNIATWHNNMNTTLAAKEASSLIMPAGSGWNVWWNELSPDQKGPAVAGKWGSILTQLYAALWSLEHKGVNYQHPNFDASDVVNRSTGELNQQGLALVPLMRATKGSVRARKLTFPGLPTMGNIGKTVVLGYCFTDAGGGSRRACIVNFSGGVETANLNNVFPSNSQLTVSGVRNGVNESTLPIRMGDHTEPRNAVVLQPYSVNFIR